MNLRTVLFLLLLSHSFIKCFSQSKIDTNAIRAAIDNRIYKETLQQINSYDIKHSNVALLLFKAEIFTILNQRDSAEFALKRCRSLYAARPHYLRNADYYFTYLKYAVKFNEFDKVDQVTRMYIADPTGTLQKKLRRYPQFSTLIPALNNIATGYYIHLAYLNAIGHPARYEAYEKSRLFDKDAYDYEEWFGNINHFYLTGKWNRRAYQSIASASLENKLDEIEAYDNLLTFNQGSIYVDEEIGLTNQQLTTKIDSLEAILESMHLPGSNSLTDAYLKRILYYKEKNERKTKEYFAKVADNKFLYYQNIFPSLDYEEQRSAYALDTLFFDFYFKENLPQPNSQKNKFEELLYYSSTWKNYLLLSEKKDLLEKKKIKLNNKQAIIDVIRFSDQGKTKYAITIFANKVQYTEVLSAPAIEKRSYRLWRNSILYNTSIPPQLLEQFFGSSVKKLKEIGIKEVFFIPDGIYHLINPGTLIDQTSGLYLSDVFDIKQRLHVYEVNKNTSKLNKNKRAILFGNPRFNQLKSFGVDRGVESEIQEGFAQLPGTEIEVTAIAELLNEDGVEVESYIDTLATETMVKSSFEQAGILHIATHGFFVNKGSGFEKQRFSGIALSRDKQNDGILYAQEIRQLPKTNASLIVLSACESSLGERSLGEGISGLKSALKGAGAEGLILSYWKVDDEVTSYFMQALYGYIKKNKNHESALKMAMKEIKLKYPSPYYWGAFDYQR